MKYKRFIIHQYKGIKEDLIIDISKNKVCALIGLNECGKSTILKAILAFDSYNDERNEQVMHLKKLKNYYDLSMPEQLKISAEIQLSDNENFKQEIFNFVKNNDLFEDFGVSRWVNDETGEKEVIEIDNENFIKKYNSFINSNVVITRTYSPTANSYTFFNNKFEMPENLQNALSQIIIKYLPICLYLNDKMSLEDKITISEENKNSFWYKIFDNLFLQSCRKSLKQVATNTDESEQMTDLNTVNKKLDDDFNTAWTELGMDAEFTDKIRLFTDLRRDINGKQILKISIQEKVKGQASENNFELNERSDGFKWYYSFVMHLLYNPINKGDNNTSVLFLLDEPGTNLNPKSQIGLLKRFYEITKDAEGMQVIYTTHSSYMLNEDYIKPNQILIVKKDSAKAIVIYDIKSYPYKYTKLSALTPLYDSLQIPFTDKMLEKNHYLLVEGIHDLYALELFADLGNDVAIFPCYGAASIIKIVPFFLMWHKKFAYIVDNDMEGIVKARDVIEDKYNTAKDVVLPFDGYEQDNNKSFEMDDIFAEKIQEWASELGVGPSYRSVIEYLYNNKGKAKVKTLLKDETIKNKFATLKTKVLEKLK